MTENSMSIALKLKEILHFKKLIMQYLENYLSDFKTVFTSRFSDPGFSINVS